MEDLNTSLRQLASSIEDQMDQLTQGKTPVEILELPSDEAGLQIRRLLYKLRDEIKEVGNIMNMQRRIPLQDGGARLIFFMQATII